VGIYEDSQPARQSVAEIVDSAATDRVLLIGEAPPRGRDWDVMVRGHDRERIEDALRSSAFQPIGAAWLRFLAGSADVVELLTPDDWRLPAAAADELFDAALPLPGRTRLCTPGPVQQLLILARKLPRTPWLLEPTHRQRVQSTLRSAPDAFELAQARTRDWGVRARLRRLHARYHSRLGADLPPRWARRPRTGAIIALSGLDGAGKSTQALALRECLAKLGYDAHVAWTPLGSNAALRALATAMKRGLARLPVGPLAHADAKRVERRVLSEVDGPTDAGGRWRRLAVPLWSTLITLANVSSYHRNARGSRLRGRIVIYDRFVLDTLVELRFSYGPESDLPVQESLARVLAPKPQLAFLLDLPAEEALRRKPDWSAQQTELRRGLYEQLHRSLGVRQIDATRPAEEITYELVREVLDLFSGPRRGLRPRLSRS
jgi:thymidylate kinase